MQTQRLRLGSNVQNSTESLGSEADGDNQFSRHIIAHLPKPQWTS